MYSHVDKCTYSWQLQINFPSKHMLLGLMGKKGSIECIDTSIITSTEKDTVSLYFMHKIYWTIFFSYTPVKFSIVKVLTAKN